MLALAIVPSPLEDEPVASYFDRCRRLNLLTSPRSLAALGLGAPWRHLDFALPTHLGIFAEVVSQFIAGFDVTTCITEHTLFPYYSWTLSEKQRALLWLRMAKPSHGPIRPVRSLCGDRTASACRPLCDECRLNDIKANGFSYVRRTSTLPLVTHCVWHGLALRYGTANNLHFARTGKGASSNSLLYAGISAEMLHESVPYLHPRERFNVELARARWISSANRVSLHEMAKHVQKVYSDGFMSPELSAFVASEESILEWLTPAFRTRQLLHPVHLALLIGAFRIAVPEPRQIKPFHPVGHRLHDINPIVSALYDSDTITEAARKCGYSVTTVATVARSEGIPFQERPKRITPAIRRRVEKALKKGADVNKVCVSFNISISSAYRLIRSSREVSESRSAALEENERLARRHEWASLMQAKPRAGRKVLRTLKPATFAWLYKHDRPWLMQKVTSTPGRHP